MPRTTSQNFCCQCPCPHGEPQTPPALARDPPTLADSQKERQDEKAEGYVPDEGTR